MPTKMLWSARLPLLLWSCGYRLHRRRWSWSACCGGGRVVAIAL